jgi:inorganic triphosphatase YgiF
VGRAASGSEAATGQPEVEIKLAGDPEVLEGLFTGTTLLSHAKGRARSKQIENVYYDTPALDLRRQGMALRVRKDGRRLEQTLKAEDGEGTPFGRTEWSTKLAAAEPALDALPEALAGDGRLAELRPLFTTRYRRRTRRLDLGANGSGAVIEAALDLGEVEADGRSEPIAELELELIEGGSDQLYDLALELHQLAPLRLECRSKAARGYALAAGAVPDWHKADALHLAPEATVGEAMAAIFGACFRHWLANEAAALDGSDPEGVHQLRVALRRLRSALTMFRPAIPAEQQDWLKRDAKWLIGQLGPARDGDVLLAEVLAPVLAARPEDGGLERLRAAAEARRAAGYETARAALAGPDHAGFVLRFGRWLAGRGWQTADGPAELLAVPIVEFAGELLKKRRRSAAKRGRDFEALDPPARHELRIALKKLRYAAEFFGSLYRPKATGKYVKRLKELQDDLGHLNDVAVAEPLLGAAIAAARKDGRAELERAAGLVLGWHLHAAGALEEGLARRWQRFARTESFWQ